jgi:hypothetical protein
MCVILGGMSILALRAGSVEMLTDGAGLTGKLTLGPDAVHVEGATARDINLGDVLEADFAETPFHLDYFSSNTTPDGLSAAWKAQDIGKDDSPGSYTYAKGAFKLWSSTRVMDPTDPTDHSFFVGRPWSGNGEWTLRVREFGPQNPSLPAGLIVREGFDAKTGGMYGIGVRGENGGYVFIRTPNGSTAGHSPPMDIPTWVRLTRNGTSLVAGMSSDGKNWTTYDQATIQFSADAWVGPFIFGGATPAGWDVMDDVTFTPGPSISDIIPGGVLLRNGSYLAGNFGQFDITGNAPSGDFSRNGKTVSIPAAEIATCILYPITRKKIAESGTQVGLLLRNDDFVAGDIQSIYWSDNVRVSSVALGLMSYDSSTVQAVFFRPMEPRPANYEIRLTDGSIIRAASLAVNKDQLVITDVSGIAVTVDPGEIAQFRAGSSKTQSLLELPWKSTSPSASSALDPSTNTASATTPEPTPKPTDTTNAAPTDAANAPVTPAAVPQLGVRPIPAVECWEGNQQEQIMVVTPETKIDFPLNGKFRAFAVKVALSPESPANAQATVLILADGKEVGRTLSLKVGDQPQFMEIALKDPATITLMSDSVSAGTRVLFIDPTAIRDNQN